MLKWHSYWFHEHDTERNSVETNVSPNFSAPMLVIKDGELVVAQRV